MGVSCVLTTAHAFIMFDVQAGPGVREFADGIFLYTTRIPGDMGGGPTFVYEVRANGARALHDQTRG